MINLEHIGCNYKESTDFIIDRPKGSDNYLFLYFHTDVYVQIEVKLEHLQPGTVILFEPGYPQYYLNPEKGFVNDWFHFTHENYTSVVESINLPLNTPIPIKDVLYIHTHILDIEKENLMGDIGSSLMTDHMITSLLIYVAREYNRRDMHKSNPHYYELELLFRDIRSTILSSISQSWSLADMATMAGLSRSRFSYLYKFFFGISPKDDLLKERFETAKHLLCRNNEPITNIALTVGYENIYQFSKQFKKVTGCSPTEYRLQTINS